MSIYDARDGRPVGYYSTPTTLVRGREFSISVKDMELAAGITPTSGMLHYVIGLSPFFRGMLQNVVTNAAGGTSVYMTAACLLNSPMSVASRLSCTPRKATGTSWVTTYRSSLFKMRSSFPT